MSIGWQITFDALNPDALARFWAEVLGYQLEPPPPGFDSWEDWLRRMNIPESEWDKASAIVDPEGVRPRIFIQKVPEAKTAKNRVHIDVNVGGRDIEPEERRVRVEQAVARAVELGARELYRKEELGQAWVTLADPEGNEFCLQ